MKRAWTYLLLTVVSACLAVPARADLEADLQAVLGDRLLDKVDVAVHIARLDAASPPVSLFRRHGDKRLIPASNMKLLTTAAALDHFGPGHRFRTMLFQRGTDLVLVGDGDPSFGDAELLRRSGWKITTIYESWAEGLAKAGINAIGNIIVDDSIFDQVFVHPSWDPRQLHFRYCAPVAGMTLNIGCIELLVQGAAPGDAASVTLNPRTRYVTVQNSCTTGRENAIVIARQGSSNRIELRGVTPPHAQTTITVPLHDPALYAATVLAETLEMAGIRVQGQVARDRTFRAALAAGVPADVRLLAVHETPLPTVLARTNKDSQNAYAESLAKRLGAATASGASAEGTWANGSAALEAFLRKVGADHAHFKLDDACGLSRENLVTADGLVLILAYSFQSPHRDVYIGTLAIGGEDGTLSDRFRGMKGRVFAKSGFINGVSGLSGYLRARDDQWYAFSIVMNGLPRYTNTRAKELQEKIVQAIDNNSVRSRR
jgi:serine-type D-Ala-D-Ala carboxypeptidase/endopeptidase (penicillin-binding protein 4)